MKVSLQDIQKARKFLKEIIPPTPLLRNSWLSDAYGCEVYLKLETMQPVGSFKIRGATYKISQLSDREKKKGVIAASAGNHAQGVAWGARKLKTSALIVMPQGASLMKVQNTQALGAEVVLAGENYDQAYEEAKKISKRSGRIFVHAYQDPNVIAGQGTAGIEIMEQLPDAEWVIGAIGGGGLMSGVATAIKALRPSTRVVGCQAKGADAMVRALTRGHAASTPEVHTFADGVAVSTASEPMRKILRSVLDDYLEADDEAIAAAVLQLMEKAKIIAEGSGALPLAVLEQLRKKIKKKKVVLVIGGGNIDVNILSRIIDRGLIRAGRRVRLNVLISDRPGSLARLTQLLSQRKANIIQAIHDRSEPSTTIDSTEVALTLETRGPEHTAQVLRALQGHVIKILSN